MPEGENGGSIPERGTNTMFAGIRIPATGGFMKFAILAVLGGTLVCGPICGAQDRTAGQAAQSRESKQGKEPEAVRIFNPDTLAKPTAGYSQVAEISDGKIVFIAGQVAQDRGGTLVGKDDFRAQVQQVFENLKAAVEAAGGNFKHVVKLNYYCAESVDPSQITAVREIRDKYVNTANPPTSTFVVVKRLVRPEWLIEVDAVAVVKK
jgi:enamine deaminase RidA (YjgF/YER057c/UK114 family)